MIFGSSFFFGGELKRTKNRCGAPLKEFMCRNSNLTGAMKLYVSICSFQGVYAIKKWKNRGRSPSIPSISASRKLQNSSHKGSNWSIFSEMDVKFGSKGPQARIPVACWKCMLELLVA